MMLRKVRILVSKPLNEAERQFLITSISAILSRHADRRTRAGTLSSESLATLLDRLADATARAKPITDLATMRDAPSPINALARKQKRLSLPRDGSRRGRPADTWKDLLLHDVREALQAAGLPRGFKYGHNTLLSDIFGACVVCAGGSPPKDLRDQWRNVWDSTSHRPRFRRL